jgi:hypothetical protein
MIWLYYGILAATFFATFAMMVQLGLWSNMITTINIVLSALIAFGYYQALGKLLVDKIDSAGQFTYLLDFMCLWLVYIIAFMVLQRLLAANLSRTRMRFKHPIDAVGGPAVALIAAFFTTGLVGSSLQAAPLAADCFNGVFTDKSRTNTATNPDLALLQMMQMGLDNDRLGTSNPPFRAVDYRAENNKMRQSLEPLESLKVRR